MDCSLPSSSIRGIFQARVLEWGTIAFSYRPYKTTYSVHNYKIIAVWEGKFVSLFTVGSLEQLLTRGRCSKVCFV